MDGSVVRDSSTSLSLLERVRHQNQDAWGRLVYLYTPLIDHWCHGWGVRDNDLDDIKQEVFQSVSTGLQTFHRDRPGDTFRGWLRVIAHRKMLDYCRRRQRQPSAPGGSDAHRRLLQLPEPDDSDTHDPPPEVRQLHYRALELVRTQFENRTWQAFWRCAVEGQIPIEVAHDLGMTPAAVRKSKSRVLRRLKDELGDLLG